MKADSPRTPLIRTKLHRLATATVNVRMYLNLFASNYKPYLNVRGVIPVQDWKARLNELGVAKPNSSAILPICKSLCANRWHAMPTRVWCRSCEWVRFIPANRLCRVRGLMPNWAATSLKQGWLTESKLEMASRTSCTSILVFNALVMCSGIMPL